MSGKDTQSDYEVIEPPRDLREHVKVTGSGDGIDMAAIARAEKALESLSGQFEDWLHDEIASLSKARDEVRTHGLIDPYAERLFRAAHDLKGQADTFGYPLITLICSSLCRLLESVEDKRRIPVALVDQHVNAVRVIAREKIKDSNNPTASTMAEALLDAVLKVVGRETPSDEEAPAGS